MMDREAESLNTSTLLPPVVVFTDLDDSLFQTRHKCDPELSSEQLTPAAYHRSGEALSFQTPHQRALLALIQSATLIPVTGRSSDALDRVRAITWSSYRVVSHGALILDPEGHPLPSWMSLIREEVPFWAQRLNDLSASISEHLHPEVRLRLILEGDFPTYLSVKGPMERLLEIAQRFRQDWQRSEGVIHHNDRNLAFLPSYTSKKRAVEHLMSCLTPSDGALSPLYIGIGDSVSDLPFLQSCHFALTPQSSQIQRELWR